MLFMFLALFAAELSLRSSRLLPSSMLFVLLELFALVLELRSSECLAVPVWLGLLDLFALPKLWESFEFFGLLALFTLFTFFGSFASMLVALGADLVAGLAFALLSAMVKLVSEKWCACKYCVAGDPEWGPRVRTRAACRLQPVAKPGST